MIFEVFSGKTKEKVQTEEKGLLIDEKGNEIKKIEGSSNQLFYFRLDQVLDFDEVCKKKDQVEKATDAINLYFKNKKYLFFF